MVKPFTLGVVVATPGALEKIESSGQSCDEFLDKHLGLERGELDEFDYQSNIAAATNGDSRVFSHYKTSAGDSLWIITEADRSATTILLPSEY